MSRSKRPQHTRSCGAFSETLDFANGSDGSFGFECHTIRGKDKMTLHMGLALTIMLAMAVGRIQANQSVNMRSLIRAA